MKDTDEKWLKSLEKQLRDYSKPLPEDDWENFASKAFSEKEEKSQRVPLYKKTAWKWMRIAAVLILLLLPSIFVWLYLGQHNEVINRVAKIEEKMGSSPAPSSKVGPAVVIDSTIVIKKQSSVSSLLAKTTVMKSSEKKELSEKENETMNVTTYDYKDEKEGFSKNEQKEKDSTYMFLPSSSTTVIEGNLASNISIGKHHRNSLGKVLGGTIGAVGTGVLTSSLLSMNSSTFENAGSNEDCLDNFLSTSFIYASRGKRISRHLGFGFSTGVSLRESLSEHLALDQNLFLQSGNWKNDIGLNLKLVWEIWQEKHWTLYLSSGPSYQFHLQNKVFNHKGLFSVQLSPGLQYNITKHFGMYIEPNINWFLNTDDHVDYGFHHLLPGTQTGLRFSF